MRFALHSAKLNGKNRFEFYDEKEYAAYLKRLQIQDELRSCVNDNYKGFEMFYQHTHPLSSSEFKMDDVQNSEYFDEYVTSHDYDRKMRTAMEDSMVEEGAYLAGAMADALAEEREILAEEKTEEAEGSVNEPAEDK